MKPDFAIASAFIEALTGDTNTKLLFKFFAQDKNDPDAPRPFWRFSTIKSIWPTIETEQARGNGVHVGVNVFDGKAAKNENVIGLRALFVDKDDGNLSPSMFKIQPNIVVQSKNGQHAYWLLADSEPLKKFTEAQKRLSLTFGTDDELGPISKSLRLPGTIHQKDKADPFLLRFKAFSKTKHTIDEIINGNQCKPLSEPPKKQQSFAIPPDEFDPTWARECFQRWLQKRPGAVQGQHGDADTLQAALRGGDFGLSPSETYDCMLDWNATCQPPWSERELRQKVDSAYRSRQKEVGADAPREKRRRPQSFTRSKEIRSNETIRTPLDEIKKKIIDGDLPPVAECIAAHPTTQADLEAYARDVGKARALKKAIEAHRQDRIDQNRQAIEAHKATVNGFIVPPGYLVDEEGTSALVPTENDIKTIKLSSDRVTITKIYTVLSTGETHVTVDWVRASRTVPLRDISDHARIVSLSTYGLDITSAVAKQFMLYLQAFRRENTIEAITVVDKMGYHDGIGFVFGDQIYGTDRKIEYWGDNLSVGKHGDRDAYLKYVAHLADHPYAQLCFYASCASPYLSRLGCPGFVVDISGRTTQGKTSAMRLAASVWGSPSLIKKWNTTPTYRERLAAAHHHVPVFLDDHKDKGSSNQQYGNNEHPIIAAIYQIADGVGRGRGTVTGVQQINHWHLVTFSSGETSVIDYDQYSDGALLRVMRLPEVPFYKRAPFLDDINTLSDHYGFIGDAIAQDIANGSLDMGAYQDHIDRWRDDLTASDIPSSLASRIAQRYAAIQLVAERVHSLIDLGWRYDAVDLIASLAACTCAKGRASVDRTEQTYHDLIAWCAGQAHRFLGHTHCNGQQGIYGVWPDRHGGDQEILITPTALRQACRDLGLSRAALIRDLMAAQLLGDQRREYVAGAQVRCHRLAMSLPSESLRII